MSRTSASASNLAYNNLAYDNLAYDNLAYDNLAYEGIARAKQFSAFRNRPYPLSPALPHEGGREGVAATD